MTHFSKYISFMFVLMSSCLWAEIEIFYTESQYVTIEGKTCIKSRVCYRDSERALQYWTDSEEIRVVGSGELVMTKPATYVAVDEASAYHPSSRAYEYGDLVFSSPFNDIPVTEVWRFSQLTGLRSVYIPDSVTSVREQAFWGCPNLKTIRFSAHLKSLPASVCWQCEGLESVYGMDEVEEVASGAFSGCSSLKEISLPVRTEVVGDTAFYNCSLMSRVDIPGVKSIGTYAFIGCGNIRSVTIQPIFKMSEVFPNAYKEITDVTLPESVEKICDFSFADCRHLRSINIPASVIEIGESAFENCRRLESITIPAGVKKIGDYAFYGCGALKEIKYLGEKPEIGLAAFVGTSIQGGGEVATLEIRNATVHYVLRSNNPDIAVPLSEDTGFVNVITEVKGGAVSVPSTWASNYPTFTQKFGDDFLKALMKPTGKIASDGSAMLVWQDYVAGTDPTKQSDTFTASITMVDGKVKVSYSPEFEDDRKDMRKYTTLGKRQLQDVDWVEVAPGEEGNYNFFKVTVEMK